MIDKDFCMSSYLAFRYIVDDTKDFGINLHHKNKECIPIEKRKKVFSSDDIDNELQKQFNQINKKRTGILLSGGMDSAILASYMRGKDAYTFRFLGGSYQREELKRAEYYAKEYRITLHYVDISWESVINSVDIVMRNKCAPVHSIEPQIYQAAIQAKNDGIELMIIGNAADYVFGGMDGLLSKDWDFTEFVNRYTYLDPKLVLNNPIDVSNIFEQYKKGNKIDFQSFLTKYANEESYSSYDNAFISANVNYFDPYEPLIMGEKLNLTRVRNGESKYMIRELFYKKYPNMQIPNKLPMPRPVDEYFKNWQGPTRKEFKKDLVMSKLTGNQKWQLWCLDRFLTSEGL